ncbi:INO80 complex subunit Ies4 domain-containing protein, nitrosative stress-induced transcript [Histoplasma ohiense]|nr:INO80 complex subunit Ies4 domain-containing protein, nitrosative stress-induced transcript [Histoplasma ohiense (nom. inval.)]
MPSSTRDPSSSSASSSAHSSSAGRSSSKPSFKLTNPLVLKLSSSLLSRFPGVPGPTTEEPSPEDNGRNNSIKSKPSSSPSPSSSSSSSSPSSTSASASAAAVTPTVVAPASFADHASDATSTPTNQSDAQRRKGIPGPKPGSKRGLGQGVDLNTTPKPRGKPGPKKKPRLEDGSIDPSARPNLNGTGTGNASTGTGGQAPTPSHKLGPKANQGAINAGLRALDRTGKPCRKWERKTFNLKSFTGVVWQVPTWAAPPKADAVVAVDVDGVSIMEDVQPTTTSGKGAQGKEQHGKNKQQSASGGGKDAGGVTTTTNITNGTCAAASTPTSALALADSSDAPATDEADGKVNHSIKTTTIATNAITNEEKKGLNHIRDGDGQEMEGEADVTMATTTNTNANSDNNPNGNIDSSNTAAGSPTAVSVAVAS